MLHSNNITFKHDNILPYLQILWIGQNVQIKPRKIIESCTLQVFESNACFTACFCCNRQIVLSPVSQQQWVFPTHFQLTNGAFFPWVLLCCFRRLLDRFDLFLFTVSEIQQGMEEHSSEKSYNNQLHYCHAGVLGIHLKLSFCGYNLKETKG